LQTHFTKTKRSNFHGGRPITAVMTLYIVLRGNNGRRLFSYPREYRMALALLPVPSGRHDCRIHALALTPYAIDLVLTSPSQEATAAFVHDFASPYAQRRNQQRDKSGRLFACDFERTPLEGDEVVAKMVHTELAPARAGMSTVNAWPWSTYWLHAGEPSRCEVPPALWHPAEWFSSNGRERYLSLFEREIAVERRRDVWLRRPGGRRAS
jgi:hypothetical protein